MISGSASFGSVRLMGMNWAATMPSERRWWVAGQSRGGCSDPHTPARSVNSGTETLVPGAEPNVTEGSCMASLAQRWNGEEVVGMGL